MKRILIFLAIVGIVLLTMSFIIGATGEQPVIIDVRTEAEWNDGHIEGATLIPYELIGDKIGAIAKDKSLRIYVYCRSGRRSQIAKGTLEKLNYNDVVNLGSLKDAATKMRRNIVK